MKKSAKRIMRYNTGGVTGTPAWAGAVQQAPKLLDALIGLFESGSKDYTSQPTLNASTMRNVVTPYNFAMGGIAEMGIDEDQLALIQEMADQQGISVEELIAQIQEPSEDEQEVGIEEGTELEEFALGGKVRSKIEAEGGEVIESPGGIVKKLRGPSHEEGGVKLNVAPGTKVYSDRLSIDGDTMQERKVRREKNLKRLTSLIDKSPDDFLLKKTLDRTSANLEMEDKKDMAIQQIVRTMYNPREEYAEGGIVSDPDPWTQYMMDAYGLETPAYIRPGGMQKSIQGTIPKSVFASPASVFTPTGRNTPPGYTPIVPNDKKPNENFLTNMQPGDYIGLSGTLFNAIAPIINSRNAAAASKPNINRFRSFGRDALDTNQRAQGIAAENKAGVLRDISTSANSGFLRNRNSAQGINTLRALDAVTTMGKERADVAATSSFTNQMLGLFGQRSQLENIRDNAVMRGETRRDNEDKADTDNYFTSMAQNLANFGEGIQLVGRNLNMAKSNQVNLKLLSQLSEHGLSLDKNGQLISL